jgi:hypothetical protein
MSLLWNKILIQFIKLKTEPGVDYSASRRTPPHMFVRRTLLSVGRNTHICLRATCKHCMNASAKRVTGIMMTRGLATKPARIESIV